MTCASCGADNRAAARFCDSCGAAQPRVCAACATPLRPAAKFCDECGRPVAAARRRRPPRPPAAPAELAVRPQPARRPATPPSTWPTGSSPRAAPSRASASRSRSSSSIAPASPSSPRASTPKTCTPSWTAASSTCSTRSTASRAPSTSSPATAIMALFGAPIAHEDHAARAVAAALAIEQAVRQYADTLRTQRGLDFAVRIGINTGPVVVGKIGDDLRMDYTAQGETVNLAARLQQVAPPGGTADERSHHAPGERLLRHRAHRPGDAQGAARAGGDLHRHPAAERAGALRPGARARTHGLRGATARAGLPAGRLRQDAARARQRALGGRAPPASASLAWPTSSSADWPRTPSRSCPAAATRTARRCPSISSPSCCR